MAHNITSQGKTVKPSRKTLRLTFRVADGEVTLIKHERLNMITPPQIGEYPTIGKHGGFWVELRDANNFGLFHRTLHFPLGDAVEVHSPDGTIRREYAPIRERTFEVLLPDYDEATSIVFCGKYIDAEKFRREQAQPSAEAPAPRTRELARFEIPEGDNSENVPPGGEK